MSNVTYDVCSKALCTYLQSDQFIIKEYSVNVSEDISKGLMGSSSKLTCKVEINGNIKVITFFIKTLPTNKFHRYLASEIGAFIKETFFYKTISSNLRKYLNKSQVFPDCYYSDNEIVILQDLTVSSYRTSNLNKELDIEHCFCAIKCLAEFHAASFLYENDLNKTLDKLYPELTFVAWYSEVETHPSHKHLLTTIKAIQTILDVHFKHQPLYARKKFIEIFKKLPKHHRTSSIHRNCLSHLDLWCNNIMFKYNNDNMTENAVIIDYQFVAYNPPAFDLMMLICFHTTDKMRKSYLNEFIKYYYESFCNVIIQNKKRPESFLTYQDLITTVGEFLEPSLAINISCKHFVLIPDDTMLPIMEDDDLFKNFLFNNRNQLILNLINEDNNYKENVFSAINDLFIYINEFNCDGHKALKTIIT